MNVLANRRIKLLFVRVILLITGFTLLSVAVTGLGVKNALFYTLVFSLCMGISILAVMYWHVKEQSHIMEAAARQIREYISGGPECTH